MQSTAANYSDYGKVILNPPVVTSTEGSTYKYESKGAGKKRKTWGRKSSKKGGSRKRRTQKRRQRK